MIKQSQINERGALRVGEARRAAEVQSSDLSAALQASEAERRALRAKYIALGERLEALLSEDHAARDAAAAAARNAAAEVAAVGGERDEALEAHAELRSKVKELKRRLAEDDDRHKRDLRRMKARYETAAAEAATTAAAGRRRKLNNSLDPWLIMDCVKVSGFNLF